MQKPHLIDPRLAYSNADLPKQTEGHPQLEAWMQPAPDFGQETYQGQQRLLHRNAFISGGDSGIGRAVALAYAREGANVAFQYLPGEEEDVQEINTLLAQEGVQTLAIPADFRVEGAMTQAIEQVVEAFGQIDILVLNAGQQIAQPTLKDLSLQQVRETFEVKVFSMYEAIKAAEDYLPAGSAIITTSSIQGFDPSDYFLDYAASNAAVVNLTVGMARYFADQGVRVNGVAPGPIWTPLQLDGGRLGAPTHFGQDTLMGRHGQPVEVAPTYVFLASNEASYITAQTFGVTGGKPINL